MATFEQVKIWQLKELADLFKKNVDGYVEEVSQSILKVWESCVEDHSEALRFLKQPMPIVGGVPVSEGAKPAFDSDAAFKKLEGAKCQTTDAKAGNLQALALPPKSARLIDTFEVGLVYNALYLEGGLILLARGGVGLIVYDDKGNQLMHYKESFPTDVAVLQGHEVALFKVGEQQYYNPKPLRMVMMILSVCKDYIQKKAVYDLGDRDYSRVTTLDSKTLAGWSLYAGRWPFNAGYIDVLDHTGNILQRIDIDCSPLCVCKSPDGNLLITDRTKIYRYDRQTGLQLLSLQVGNVLEPGAIFSLPCGSTLVMDRSRRTLCLLGQDSLWKADIWTVPTGTDVKVERSWQKLFAMGDICLFSNWNNVYVLKLDQ